MIDLTPGDVATALDTRGHAIVVRAGESDKSAGTTTFIASTDTPDRAMDIVKQDWRLGDFRANPVILDNHNTLRVVGSAHQSLGGDVRVPKAGDPGDVGKLMIRVAWDQQNPDPAIRAVGHQHLNGFRNAGSVGFNSGKKTLRSKLPPDHPAYQAPIKIESYFGSYDYAGTYYEQNTLLEFSSATIPMNAEALQRAMGGEPDPAVAAAVREWEHSPEWQLLQRLAEFEPDDLVRRLRAVGETVTRDLAAELGEAITRRSVIALLTPDLQASMRAEPEWSRTLRGVVEAVPTTPRPLSFEQRVLDALETT